MQICFVVDNSLTMSQKCCNNMSLLEYAKGAIQNSLRNMSRNSLNHTENIHLYKTSSPIIPISSYEHPQSHLLHQLKNIKSQFPTYPAETLKQCLKSLGRFRILTTAESALGYREGQIIEPVIVLFFTDKMTIRKIQTFHTLFGQNQYQLRSEYRLIFCRICPPSLSQKNVNTYDVFKREIENQEQTIMLNSFVDKMNGIMILLYNFEQLSSAVQNCIDNFRPSLAIQLVCSNLSIYQNLFGNCEWGKQVMKDQNDKIIKVEMISMKKKYRIPLPLNIVVNQVSQIKIEVEKIVIPRYFVDFTKSFNNFLSSNPPYQKFKICKFDSLMTKDFSQQFNHPLFWLDSKNTQYLMGFLRLGGNQGMEIHWLFANFPVLDGILMNMQQKLPFKVIQPSINSYLTSIPHYYFKFLQHYLQNMYNIKISQNQPSANTLVSTQNKLQQIRSSQKKDLIELAIKNMQQHNNNTSKCCSIYSQDYHLYSSQEKKKKKTIIENVFSQMVQQLLKINQQVFPNIYLQINTQSVPITRQLDKYNLKRVGEQFNQNITIQLGNPFKKTKEQSVKKSVVINQILTSKEMQDQGAFPNKEEKDKVFQQIIKQPQIKKKKSQRKESLNIVYQQGVLDIITDVSKLCVGNAKKVSFNPINYNQESYQNIMQIYRKKVGKIANNKQ